MVYFPSSIYFLKINLFFIDGYLLYRILLFTVKPQHESAIGIRVYMYMYIYIYIYVYIYVCVCVCVYIYIYIYISPPFGNTSPSHPSRLIQSPCLSFLCHTANSPWLSILHMVIRYPCYCFYTSHPLLPSSHVHNSILHVCFSTVAL